MPRGLSRRGRVSGGSRPERRASPRAPVPAAPARAPDDAPLLGMDGPSADGQTPNPTPPVPALALSPGATRARRRPSHSHAARARRRPSHSHAAPSDAPRARARHVARRAALGSHPRVRPVLHALRTDRERVARTAAPPHRARRAERAPGARRLRARGARPRLLQPARPILGATRRNKFASWHPDLRCASRLWSNSARLVPPPGARPRGLWGGGDLAPCGRTRQAERGGAGT